VVIETTAGRTAAAMSASEARSIAGAALMVVVCTGCLFTSVAPTTPPATAEPAAMMPAAAMPARIFGIGLLRRGAAYGEFGGRLLPGGIHAPPEAGVAEVGCCP
jgi:hypothetical protein